jgi:hypothetical protein
LVARSIRAALTEISPFFKWIGRSVTQTGRFGLIEPRASELVRLLIFRLYNKAGQARDRNFAGSFILVRADLHQLANLVGMPEFTIWIFEAITVSKYRSSSCS